jgi:putative membrane protein
MKNRIILLLKGMGMGAADVVPGVSGGTIAFITGIYTELIDSIKSFDASIVQLLFKGKFKEIWEKVNGNFLLTVFLGIGISVVTLASVLKNLLETHPVLVWSFFFGLIVASAIYVAKQIEKWNLSSIIAIIAGTILAYYITVVTPAETTESWWFLILSGALAICAMILPGISGSFILLLLGKYEFILTAVSEFNITVIALVGIGAVAGIISFSKLLSWLLHKYYSATIALLAGFMVGSLNKIWPWKETVSTFVDRHGETKPLFQKNVLPQTFENVTGEPSQLTFAIILAIVGFALIFIIERYSGKFANKNA